MTIASVLGGLVSLVFSNIGHIKQKMQKRRPVVEGVIYMYMYIYMRIYAGELFSVPLFLPFQEVETVPPQKKHFYSSHKQI